MNMRAQNSSAKRILIVDDDPSFLKVLSHRLESEGYVVRGFESVTRAREDFAVFDPDLVVIDRCLPDADGLGWAGRLKAFNPLLSVFVVTALESLVDKNDPRFDGIYGKPIDWKAFLAEARRAFEAENNPSRKVD